VRRIYHRVKICCGERRLEISCLSCKAWQCNRCQALAGPTNEARTRWGSTAACAIFSFTLIRRFAVRVVCW